MSKDTGLPMGRQQWEEAIGRTQTGWPTIAAGAQRIATALRPPPRHLWHFYLPPPKDMGQPVFVVIVRINLTVRDLFTSIHLFICIFLFIYRLKPIYYVTAPRNWSCNKI